MKSQPDKKQKKIHIEKELRLRIYACSMVVGVALLIGLTYAWYSLQKKEAETEEVTVQKPYQLVLGSPGETDSQLLSIGGMSNGETKQIVFSVSCQKAQKDFEYELELVHTDNLKLKYDIFRLENWDSETDQDTGVIVVEDSVTGEDTQTTYWVKGDELAWTDVSDERHEQAGLKGTKKVDGSDLETNDIINRGTYISYAKTEDSEGNILIDNELNMKAGYDPESKKTTDNTQYFVLEISWDISNDSNNSDEEEFDMKLYEKETDMIYILAKALQPEPEASGSTN